MAQPVAAEARGTTAVAWLLFCVVVLVPFVHWADTLAPGKPLNAYTVFPLLGVWAWSLMWTSYVHGTLSMVSDRFVRSPLYGRVTGVLVLMLLMAHPGLLITGLLVDTGEDAPGTVLLFGGEGEGVFVVLGMAALVAFFVYEVLDRLDLKARMGRRWRWVGLAQIAAMTAVFVHSLALGRHLDEAGWFRHYGVALGALLLPCFAVIGRADWRTGRGGPGSR